MTVKVRKKTASGVKLSGVQSMHYYQDAGEMLRDMFCDTYDQLNEEERNFLDFCDSFEPYGYIVINYELIVTMYENDITSGPETVETFIKNWLDYQREFNL